MRVLAGVLRVLPSRDEEHVHTRLVRSDRFLLDAADRAYLAVQGDFARCGDLVTAIDVASELFRSFFDEEKSESNVPSLRRIGVRVSDFVKKESESREASLSDFF